MTAVGHEALYFFKNNFEDLKMRHIFAILKKKEKGA
jgi:hypothetical protein